MLGDKRVLSITEELRGVSGQDRVSDRMGVEVGGWGRVWGEGGQGEKECLS